MAPGLKSVASIGHSAQQGHAAKVFRREGDFVGLQPDIAPAGSLPPHLILRSDVAEFLTRSRVQSTVAHNSTADGKRGILAIGPRLEFSEDGALGLGLYTASNPNWPRGGYTVEIAAKWLNPIVGTTDKVRAAQQAIYRAAGGRAREQADPGWRLSQLLDRGVDGLIVTDRAGPHWSAIMLRDDAMRVVVEW